MQRHTRALRNLVWRVWACLCIVTNNGTPVHLNHYTCPDTLIVDYRYYGNQLDVASFIYSTVAVVIQIDIQARVLLLVKCCFFYSTDGFTDSNRFIRSNTSRR